MPLVEDEIIEVASLKKFLQESIKVTGGKAGNLSKSVTISREKIKVQGYLQRWRALLQELFIHYTKPVNFLHTGAPKTWYTVPGDRASELEEVIRVHGYGGNPDRLVLGEKTTLMSPDVLVARGVPCCRLVQYPGEFVVTFPRAYHIGFSHG
ncbi:Lysine-specific demethylase SE14 [Zea mays]|uniref:Lysine-specific demethylase SE14 n=1 Tax=Zea mays TaxID=4577 RepID=A0A3L6E630_MAIZE|nr:Lysine-specific demethylase SE14 [Zea mays]